MFTDADAVRKMYEKFAHNIPRALGSFDGQHIAIECPNYLRDGIY